MEYGLSGAGKVSVSSECIPGVTDIPLVETSTSSDLISWSDWAAVGADGKMPSPARAYISTIWIFFSLSIYLRFSSAKGMEKESVSSPEDFTYSKEVRVSSLDCSAFTNPYQMLEFTRMRLADYCRPTVSYVLNAMDLSVLTGYEHEAWELGDYVRVEDKDLGLSVTTTPP